MVYFKYNYIYIMNSEKIQEFLKPIIIKHCVFIYLFMVLAKTSLDLYFNKFVKNFDKDFKLNIKEYVETININLLCLIMILCLNIYICYKQDNKILYFILIPLIFYYFYIMNVYNYNLDFSIKLNKNKNVNLNNNKLELDFIKNYFNNDLNTLLLFKKIRFYLITFILSITAYNMINYYIIKYYNYNINISEVVNSDDNNNSNKN